jgi:hypothetical protein
MQGTWDQLRFAPAMLFRLTIEGKAKIIGKDKFGRYIYRITKRQYERAKERWYGNA